MPNAEAAEPSAIPTGTADKARGPAAGSCRAAAQPGTEGQPRNLLPRQGAIRPLTKSSNACKWVGDRNMHPVKCRVHIVRPQRQRHNVYSKYVIYSSLSFRILPSSCILGVKSRSMTIAISNESCGDSHLVCTLPASGAGNGLIGQR